METKTLLGVKINNISKEEFLNEVSFLIKKKAHAYVVTPYSEFFVWAQKDLEFKRVLNEANISTADGFGVSLGLKYFQLKGKFFALMRCLLNAVFNKKFFKGVLKAKLSGSEFIYDLAGLAQKKHYKIFLLGGFDFGKGNTGEITKRKLEQKFQGIQIVGTYAGTSSESEEDEIVKLINEASPDILIIAYGPVKQEKWIYRNKEKLKPMVSFCLGGTFDYVAGEKKQVPKLLRRFGLEGILRPFFSERGNIKLIYKRLKRAWGGILRFLLMLYTNK